MIDDSLRIAVSYQLLQAFSRTMASPLLATEGASEFHMFDIDDRF